VEEGYFQAQIGGVVQEGVIDPCAFTAESYTYIAWAVQDEDYMLQGFGVNDDTGATNALGAMSSTSSNFLLAVIDLLNDVANTGDLGIFDEDVNYQHEDGTEHTLMRLREGIERFFITDINNPAASAEAQSELAIMYDLLSTTVEEYNHVPGGSNTLYMDGHAQFNRFPSEYPASRAWASIVSLF